MARLRLGVGTRYERDGHVYVVRQVLPDDHLLVENQSFGGQRVVARDDLIKAWAAGTLLFEIAGPHTQPSASTALTTRVGIADLAQIPAAQRAAAWRRYALIEPSLVLAPHERTRSVLDAHVARLRSGQATPPDG